MSINLTKIQNRVDKLTSIFTNIVTELETQIDVLNNAIADNEQIIYNAKVENEAYGFKISEYDALKNKVKSIIE